MMAVEKYFGLKHIEIPSLGTSESRDEVARGVDDNGTRQ
jgi:hypothetical protein